MVILRSIDKTFLYKMKNYLRQITNRQNFLIVTLWNENLVQVKSNRPFNTHIVRTKTMIWFKLIGFYENYSWGTYQLQNYAICWRYEWDRKKDDVIREVPRFSETQYHLRYDAVKMWRRCHFKENGVIRAYPYCAKKNTHYPWTWWSQSRDMWFGRYRWSLY